MTDSVEQALTKLFPAGKGLFLAYDQGLEHGPTDFSGDNADPAFIIDLAAQGEFDGLILHQGIAGKYYPAVRDKVSLILKLNGKTALQQGDPLSLSIASVEEAQKLGASAVGYTVYIGSEHEEQMLAEFGQIVEEAHAVGLPVIGWMYPRGKAVPDSTDPSTIAYAARIGMEVGADVVKIHFPGDVEHLKDLLKLVGKTKVVIAGGLRTEPEEFTDHVKEIIQAGAAGVAVGRNVWQADDPLAVSRQLRKVIHP